MADSPPYRVLFVCVGNSCRSPMAEALARYKHGDVIDPTSCGLAPASIIQANTYECLREVGVPYDKRSPTPLSATDWGGLELVVNMSGGPIRHLMRGYEGPDLFWPVPDPIGRSMAAYREALQLIERLVDDLAHQLRNQPSREG